MTGDNPPQVEIRIAVHVTAILIAAVLLAFGGVGVVVARSLGSAAPIGATRASTTVRPNGVPVPSLPGPSGDPLRVRIPSIGVVAPLVRLGLNADRTLEVPGYEAAGWYTGASRPGNPGPSVIAAHVDSKTGPAVFYRLRDLAPGDLIHVDYHDGSVTFSVQTSESFPKSGFPTGRVYGPTEGSELRLITCDGTFDRTARSYRSNLVVWAETVTAA
ncbi:MAG: class F sortase [Acidimicrobiales bacterium]|nr:class F sortase [Acidimicrobiales bacterium]